MTDTDTQLNFDVTKAAALQIQSILTKQANNKYLRVAVLGGGCSGFQYDFQLTAQRNDDDHLIEAYGASLLIDETSLPFLADCKLDYVQELIGSHFKISNPRAVAQCGCGVSFSI